MAFDTLPNRLSVLRIACVPIVVLFLFKDNPWHGFFAAFFFGIAGVTDYFDGYYARIQKSTTVIGQLLDPLADKFLVASSLIMLMKLGRVGPVIVIVLICREMAITGLRSIAAAEGIVIAASNLGKWKTGKQMAAIPMLMLNATYLGVNLHLMGTVFIWISLLISVWSAQDYIVDFFKAMRERAQQRKKVKLRRKALRRAMRQQKSQS